MAENKRKGWFQEFRDDFKAAFILETSTWNEKGPVMLHDGSNDTKTSDIPVVTPRKTLWTPLKDSDREQFEKRLAG